MILIISKNLTMKFKIQKLSKFSTMNRIMW